jgi:PncC family amidohydrolase
MVSAKKLITKLAKEKLTITLAESITGGYASYLLTKTPGSSKVFKGGFIVYSLDAKEKLFNLQLSLLTKAQGVSKEIALNLAKKVRKKLNSNIGASIVGFAGPSAKNRVKVGTTYLAVASAKGVTAKKYIIKGSRDAVRKNASKLLINFIYEYVYRK